MGLADVLAAVMLVSLGLYAMLGGADFGGGIWDLLASGPRRREQRALIEGAIGPVWEANHVWLVLIVVILFSAFPAAFAEASIALHVPLTLVLVGVVFRGSAFVFLNFEPRGRRFEKRWLSLFGVSSLLTPFFLGVTLGALATTKLHAARAPAGAFADRFVWTWLQPFPLLVGVLSSCLCALLAAVYLAVEAEDKALREDFRTRALWAVLATFVAGGAAHFGARVAEPARYLELSDSPWSWMVLAAVLGAVGLTAWFLRARRYRLARVTAVGLALWTIAGWALWQDECLIRPDVTIHSAAAPEATLRLLVIALAVGAAVLFPSHIWLLRVFKKKAVFGSERRQP
jgi:cytochrome d ubiquinol oxidase subunit II